MHKVISILGRKQLPTIYSLNQMLTSVCMDRNSNCAIHSVIRYVDLYGQYKFSPRRNNSFTKPLWIVFMMLLRDLKVL